MSTNRREYNWNIEHINNAINTIKDEEMPVICVPSYKRGHTSNTLELLKNTNLKVYVFIYEDEYELYKPLENYNNFTIVFCTFEGKGLHKKRNFINNYMFERGNKFIFQVDDDMINFKYGHTIKNTRPTNKRENIVIYEYITIEQCFKTMYYMYKNFCDNNNVTTLTIDANCVNSWRNFWTEPDVVEKFNGSVIFLNLELLNKNNLNYRTDVKTWEDLLLTLDCYCKGLSVRKIDWLGFMNPSRRAKPSVIFYGNDAMKDMTTYTMLFYKVFGELLCLRYRPNQYTGLVDINHGATIKRFKKMYDNYGKITVTYNQEVLDLCNKGDWEGFGEYYKKLKEKKSKK